jgi:protein-disulfide isomerase
MKKNKNENKKFIIVIAIILVAAIFLAVSNMVKNNNKNKQVSVKINALASDAKEQAYTASKIPTLKDDDKMFGSKNAPVKIFVYEDSSSVYSAKLAGTLDKIYSDEPNNVAIIVRPFVSENSSDSKEGALAIECAGDQNKWTAMRALIFSKTKNEKLSPEELNGYAKQIGLDENSFSACLTNQVKSAKIEELSSEAGNYDVIGAPTIFIGDEMILGARPYEDYVDSNGENVDGLKTIIARKLK